MKKFVMFFALFAFVATAGYSATTSTSSDIIEMDCEKCGDKKKCSKDCSKMTAEQKANCAKSCAAKASAEKTASKESAQAGGAAMMKSCGGKKMGAGCCAHGKKAPVKSASVKAEKDPVQ